MPAPDPKRPGNPKKPLLQPLAPPTKKAGPGITKLNIARQMFVKSPSGSSGPTLMQRLGGLLRRLTGKRAAVDPPRG